MCVCFGLLLFSVYKELHVGVSLDVSHNHLDMYNIYFLIKHCMYETFTFLLPNVAS